MAFFEWNQDLSIDNPEIDGDHRHLIRLVNEFWLSANNGSQVEQIKSTLDALVYYTQTHFQREELAMAAIAYDKLKAHQEQHRKLLARVLDLQTEMRQGRQSIAIETAELLKYWLTSHIMLSDKHLAQSIRLNAPQKNQAE